MAPPWRCGCWAGIASLRRRPFYQPLKSTRELVTTHHTHVQVEGIVLAVLSEDDGDTHIRLSDGTTTICTVPAYMAGACIVVEVRPGTTTYHPHKGERVLVQGVSRYDREHKWWEVHPCDSVVRLTQ